jgi:hypothetical protein
VSFSLFTIPKGVFRDQAARGLVMDLYEVIDQVAVLLRKRGRLSYQALKYQFKLDDAHQMLSEVYHWFTEGFDTKDLKDAKTLLEELER